MDSRRAGVSVLPDAPPTAWTQWPRSCVPGAASARPSSLVVCRAPSPLIATSIDISGAHAFSSLPYAHTHGALPSRKGAMSAPFPHWELRRCHFHIAKRITCCSHDAKFSGIVSDPLLLSIRLLIGNGSLPACFCCGGRSRPGEQVQVVLKFLSTRRARAHKRRRRWDAWNEQRVRTIRRGWRHRLQLKPVFFVSKCDKPAERYVPALSQCVVLPGQGEEQVDIVKCMFSPVGILGCRDAVRCCWQRSHPNHLS